MCPVCLLGLLQYSRSRCCALVSLIRFFAEPLLSQPTTALYVRLSTPRRAFALTLLVRYSGTEMKRVDLFSLYQCGGAIRQLSEITADTIASEQQGLWSLAQAWLDW